MPDDAVDPAVHHRVLSIVLMTDHSNGERIGPQGYTDENPTDCEQPEPNAGNHERWARQHVPTENVERRHSGHADECCSHKGEQEQPVARGLLSMNPVSYTHLTLPT